MQYIVGNFYLRELLPYGLAELSKFQRVNKGGVKWIEEISH